MPSKARVEAFVAAVVKGHHVEAMRQFYAEDASMQENLGPIRKGRETLIAGEQGFLDSIKSINTREPDTVLVDGDKVVIRWIFDIVGKDGGVRVLDELAHQTWRGDHIVAERFYYDPAQMSPAKP